MLKKQVRGSVVSLTDFEVEEAHFAAVAGVLVLGFPRTFLVVFILVP